MSRLEELEQTLQNLAAAPGNLLETLLPAREPRPCRPRVLAPRAHPSPAEAVALRGLELLERETCSEK